MVPFSDYVDGDNSKAHYIGCVNAAAAATAADGDDGRKGGEIEFTSRSSHRLLALAREMCYVLLLFSFMLADVFRGCHHRLVI